MTTKEQEAAAAAMQASYDVLDQTGKVLWDMLKESTGRHFLDSGGISGRSWQRNQIVDFSLVARIASTITSSPMIPRIVDRAKYTLMMIR